MSEEGIAKRKRRGDGLGGFPAEVLDQLLKGAAGEGKLATPPRRPGDPLATLERAWARYHGNVEAPVKDGVTDENRSTVVATIRRHAQAIESLREKVA